MRAEPVVSAVIPVYEGERYLAEAIESVLAQTAGAPELIIVDDGSTDRSLGVARRRAPDARCISQDHRGAATARNRGAAAARGDYIAFLDADDVWEPDKLDRQLAAFDADPETDLVFGHQVQFHSPELKPEVAAAIERVPEPQPARLAQTMLARRDAWERVGPFGAEWRVGEFLDWLMRAREMGLREVMLSDIVVRRRLHPDSLTLGSPSAFGDYAAILKASIDRRRERARE
jgi:glycosyltransferase involved in cell wall biosynthesis